MARGRIAGVPQRRYTKNLSHTTSLRIEDDLREEAENAAQKAGLTFAQFLRQSLRRNIDIHEKIEKLIVEQVAMTLK